MGLAVPWWSRAAVHAATISAAGFTSLHERKHGLVEDSVEDSKTVVPSGSLARFTVSPPINDDTERPSLVPACEKCRIRRMLTLQRPV